MNFYQERFNKKDLIYVSFFLSDIFRVGCLQALYVKVYEICEYYHVQVNVLSSAFVTLCNSFKALKYLQNMSKSIILLSLQML